MSVSIHAYDAFNALFDSGVGILIKIGAVIGLVALVGIALKKRNADDRIRWAAIGLVAAIGIGIALTKALQSG